MFRRTCDRLRPAAALVLLLSLAPALGARIGGDDRHSWTPLKVGNRWSYLIQKERHFTRAEGSPSVSRIEGEIVEEVVRRVNHQGIPAYEVNATGSERDVLTGASTTQEQTYRLSSEPEGTRLRDAVYNGKALDLAEPMTLLPAGVAPGDTWHFASFRQEGLSFEIDAEAVGYEDVTTPAGDFSGCLKIRYSGVVGGSLDGAAMAEIEEGRLEAEEWLARGIGTVKTNESIRFVMRFPNGARVRAEEIDRRVLDGYQVRSGADPLVPAAPAP